MADTTHNPGGWVQFDPLKHTYDTPDGTAVPAEKVDNAQTLVDVLDIALLREKQRASVCPGCGGDMHGDGYTQARVCESVERDPSWEPDSGPHYCEIFDLRGRHGPLPEQGWD